MSLKDKTCACGASSETVPHYLLHCPLHTEPRNTLASTVEHLTQHHLTTSVLLQGSPAGTPEIKRAPTGGSQKRPSVVTEPVTGASLRARGSTAASCARLRAGGSTRGATGAPTVPVPIAASTSQYQSLMVRYTPVTLSTSFGRARPRLVEPSSDTGTKLARSTHDFKNFTQVGRGTEEGRPNISRSSREGRPYSATVARFSKTKYGRDSWDVLPNTGRLPAAQGRATGELRLSWKRALRPQKSPRPLTKALPGHGHWARRGTRSIPRSQSGSWDNVFSMRKAYWEERVVMGTSVYFVAGRRMPKPPPWPSSFRD
ncbi:hypothetical protein Bbelb_388200 [Branchiostoma belcheri]|nr:hypothetical protein Bbelb_388200 [Branchiostoma belcheri]